MTRSLPFACALFAVLMALPARAQTAPKPGPTPAEVVAAAPEAAWKDIGPENMLVMTLSENRKIIIHLASGFSPAHVANIKALARAHWWDGTSVYRVQDNYVTQWGDVTEKKPLPAGIASNPPQDYTIAYSNTVTLKEMPAPDSYTHLTGFVDGWPVATDHDRLWMTHCYGMVGVARNLAPDAGDGSALYTVIGHAPRHLDRNIALVGRVIAGMEHLSSLPRGTQDLGIYGKDQVPTPIVSVRLASALPVAERPRFQVFDTASQSFADYAYARSHRLGGFFNIAADGADICNIPVPIRAVATPPAGQGSPSTP